MKNLIIDDLDSSSSDKSRNESESGFGNISDD